MTSLEHMDESNAYKPSTWDSCWKANFLLETNKVTEAAQKHAVLLIVTGPKTFSIIHFPVCPAKSSVWSFQEIIGILKTNFYLFLL